MRPGQFIAFETLLVDPECELWGLLGSAALLGYLAHRAAHQQFTSSDGKRGKEARETKQRQTYYETEKMLGQRVGVSEATVKRANRLLRRVGLVECVLKGRQGRANHYRLPPVTISLLVEATLKAKVIRGRGNGQGDRKRGSQRPLVAVTETVSGGQGDPLSLEVRSRR